MLETEQQILVETLADSLETMAFVALMPAEVPTEPPAELRIIAIHFVHGEPAQLELAAPRAFGQMLSSNILGVEPDDEAARTGADDALREVVNVTCGNLLNRAKRENGAPLRMGLPKVQKIEPALAWKSFTTDPSAFVLNADGHTIAIRLKAA
jgi:hypothetical protein